MAAALADGSHATLIMHSENVSSFEALDNFESVISMNLKCARSC